MSEADRSDPYNGLSEVLGPDRAEILMAQMLRIDPAEVATRSDLAGLRSDLAELRAELSGGLFAVNQRPVRLFLALLVGMFGVAATPVPVNLRVA
jgi:hypothetical protein